MSVSIEVVGTHRDGTPMHVATITGPGGMQLRVLDLGGIVQSLRVPDRDGTLGEVVLGHDAVEAYHDDPFYLGALVGRVANRISHGHARIDGHEVQLTRNLGAHHLHGGQHGFHRARWALAPFEAPARRGVVLTHVSPDGTDGYPGTLATTVTYTITDTKAWIIDWHAVTDRPTLVNPTQHAYVNLAGRGDIGDHTLAITADRYLPQDADRLPVGHDAPVAGTDFDLRHATPISAMLARQALAVGGGLDHSFVLRRGATAAVQLAHPASGRRLTLTSTAPVVHGYTGNVLDGRPGRPGQPLVRHGGICLEMQHHPDAPRHAAFPSIVLRPGETFRARTILAFDLITKESR